MTIEPTLETPTRTPAPAAGTSGDRRAASLRGLCGGQVHLPGDPGYDAARFAWSAAVDLRPAAVALPRDAADVVNVVRAAVAAGLRVAPQSTGHNAGPLAAQDLSDVVIVRTTALDQVSIDAEHRVARVGGGALWLPAVEAAAEHGLAALHGSSPDVGIAGYSLGGGMGWYARKLGLAANSLTAVELVTADGNLVRADASPEPRAVLGGPGRGRQLRGGHRPGVLAVPDRHRLRRHARLGRPRRREGAAPLGRLGPRRPGRGHHLVPAAEPPADAGAAARAAWPVGRRDRRRGARHRPARPGDPRRPARAVTGDRHLRPGARGVADAPAHGPRGTDAVRVGLHDARCPARRGSRRLPGPGRAGHDHVAAARRAAPARRRAGPSAPRRGCAPDAGRRVRGVRRRGGGHPRAGTRRGTPTRCA